MTDSVTRIARRWVPLLVLGIGPAAHAAHAQDLVSLPRYSPVNPVAETRSGLYLPGMVEPGAGWRLSLGFDYASLIEYNIQYEGAITRNYLLDAEVSRLEVRLTHDLSSRYFVEASASVGGAEPGVLDGFFNWYHGLLGLDIPERDARPIDGFAYRIDLPDSLVRVRSAGGHMGDLRISLGRRHNSRLQTVLTTTLPTGTGGAGYSRGVPALGISTILLAPIGHRASYQGSVGLGFTPSHGDLGAYQRQLFTMLSSGLAYRIWGHQSLYAQLFYHSPYYLGTGYRALDRPEFSLRYGWMLKAGGRTWIVGMTEDLVPAGPAVDAVFEFGVDWR